MTDYILSSLKLDEIQNHDDFKVIWFSSYDYVPEELTKFTDFIEIYHTFEECDKKIREIQTERQILLVFAAFYQYLSHFNDLPQVQSIYILQKNSEYEEFKKENCSKLVNVFTDERGLAERLRQDILLTYRNDLSIIVSKNMKIELSFINFNTNTLMFLWNQFFTYYLVNSSDSEMDQLKKDMIEQCRLEYQTYTSPPKDIDDFGKTCTLDNVLDWYTKDSFVFRLTNRALRTRNADLICKYRYFIILLYRKLTELAKQQQKENLTTVYRGQMMKRNELEALQSNVGHPISINTIMSTSRREDVARGFIFGAPVGVLFKINIANARNNLYPFADISQYGTKQHEEEILFFPGTVFRIDSVEQENETTWIVQLTLTKETIEQIEQIINGVNLYIGLAEHFPKLAQQIDDYRLFTRYHIYLTKKNFFYDDIAIFFANLDISQLLSCRNNSEKAIKYYEKLLRNDRFINESKFIVLHVIIGQNYFRLKRYDDSLVYYNTALSLLADINRLTSELHSNIGDVFKEKTNFRSALSSYQKALDILVGYYGTEKTCAEIYRTMADIYRQQNQNADAMNCESQANEIESYKQQRSVFLDDETLAKIRPHQPDIDRDLPILEDAHQLYTGGMHLVRHGEFAQGLEKLLQAEKLFTERLWFRDYVVHKLAKLYEHVAFVYLCWKDYLKALATWKKAINIRSTFNL